MAVALDAAGKTQQEFAAFLQSRRPAGSTRVTQGYVAQMITGQRNAAPDILEAAATFTAVPLTYIATGVGWEPPTARADVGQPPKRTSTIPLDAQCVSLIRLHGRMGYRLSGEACRAVAAIISKDTADGRPMSDFDDLFVISLVREPKHRPSQDS